MNYEIVYPIEEFTVRQQGKSRIFVLKDNATGVEYIIVHIGEGVCITPRLNCDGSLYCGPEPPEPSPIEKHHQYLLRKENIQRLHRDQTNTQTNWRA